MSFRVDGCGTYDKNTKIKFAGEYKCPSCGRLSQFYIYEQVKKITVLYVPVAKIKKEYGVYCEKCDKGYKLTEQQMTNACNGDLRYIHSLLGDAGTIISNNTNIDSPMSTTNTAPKPDTCPNCKTPIGEGMSFCISCGTKVR